MKHGKMTKWIAVVLVCCMSLSIAMPAGAAGRSVTINSDSMNQWKNFWKDFFGSITSGSSGNTDSDTNTDDGNTDADSNTGNTGDSNGAMTLVEDDTTVSEGTALRASTYVLSNGATTYANSTTTLKYFPVTLYNYQSNGKSINDATHQLELDNASGNATIEYVETTVTLSSDNSAYANNGYYVLVDENYHEVTSIVRNTNNNRYTWTISYSGGSVRTNRSWYSTMSYTLYTQETVNGISKWEGIYFGGNDWGAKVGGSDTYNGVTATYANWNKWTGNFTVSGQTTHGNKTYSGLVESKLDANKNIIFTKTEAGIFTNDTSNKDVYTNVGLPFVYEGGYYTFDADTFGAYFHDDTDQGTSGVPASNTNLYYSSTPQSHDFSSQDKRTKGWFPFNDAASVTSVATYGTADYFFGMNATIPFTMTANGRMSPNDDDSEPITFSFSGDDDVWVFIDGQLVLDIGGVRNGMNAEINFAENTWKITAMQESIDGNSFPAVDVNGAAIRGTIFNDGDTTGTLNQTRETFAATDSHELTIFYLERGAGSSNCKIQFNLPMKDTLSVKKLVRETDSEDKALDADTLAQINNRDFGFTLYKDDSPVANVNYSLLNENGQYISMPSTDANGHFTLKNGQTAKFVGEINSNSYYVVEDKDADADSFWQVPTWTYTAEVANGTTSTVSTTDGQSMTVTANGSGEAEDSIVFTCTNIWKHQNTTSISAVDDKIVIDYGLSVVIDVLANDTVSNGTKSIESVTEAQYGTVTIKNGKIAYQLTKQLTGVEVLTYTVKATATSGVESDNQTATANVYIIPATSMYYEENFSGLVTFSNGWTTEGTAQTDPQEPGVVGTVGDSPYGSDEAYLNDSGDSNGSSKYVNTTDGAASFSYTFTGTGTSFFARTDADAAYMRVVVTTDLVPDIRRNNIYKAVDGTDVGTLYNIPVYTIDGLDYGTYTVTVTLMKANEAISRGKDFYLDGIRVINPLNSADANASIAYAAYATDGEANMTVVTLRQKLLGEADMSEDGLIWGDSENFVVFTDTNGQITSAEEYKSNGPKEEVYLNNGQSISFSLYDWDANTNKIYLGVKAPLGSGSVSINGNTLTLSNAADCYYDISGYASIATDEDGIKIATFEIKAAIGSLISVTNIKVTGNAEFTIVDQIDEDVKGSEGGDVNGDTSETYSSLKSKKNVVEEEEPSVEEPAVDEPAVDEPVSGGDDENDEIDANVDDSPVSGDEPSDDDIIVDVTVE